LIRDAKPPRRRIEVVLLGAFLLAACGRADPPALTGARRIVSLYPAATEILFALGAGDRVVARSKWCDHPPEASALPILGDAVGTSAERVLALDPDLVLVGSRIQEETLAPLASRIRVVRVTVDTTDDVFALVTKLAWLAGVPERGRDLDLRIRVAMQEARHRVGRRDGVSWVFVAQREPLIVAGTSTYVDGLLSRLGAENVARGLSGAWPTLSLETLLARDPDVVLDGAMTDPGDFWDRFPGLSKKVVRVTDTAVLRPGPRMPEALELLGGLLPAESR
jgi:iron complex transport system substrate-binding protein